MFNFIEKKLPIVLLGEQLLRDKRVLKYVMSDLDLNDDHMTLVVALPNLTRSNLIKALDSCHDLHKVSGYFLVMVVTI